MKAFWKLSGISEKSENGGTCVYAFSACTAVPLKMDFLRHFYGKLSLGFSYLQF